MSSVVSLDSEGESKLKHRHRVLQRKLTCIFQNFQCREPSRRTHDPSSGMGSRSAHVQVLDRSPEARKSRHRAQEEKLLQRKFALKNIAFAQSPFALKVEWCHDLFMQDDVLQIWRVLGNGVDNRVSEIVFQLVPM